MKTLLRWISPFLLGVVMFNCIRLVTDLPLHDPFWANSLTLHLQSLSLAIVLCYVFDFHCRYYMQRMRKKNVSTLTEYSLLVIYTFLFLNVVLWIGDRTGWLYMGNAINDYVIANVICIPFLLLYYIMIRNAKLEQEYNRQTLLLEKIKVDQLEMELKFLRAQYHPHFLFNALNTVYFQIDEENKQPRRTLEILSELLRYQLYSGNSLVPVKKEIDYLTTYMSFQRLRMSERLVVDAVFSEELKEQPVYPLLFLPLVENAFKYVGGEYHIDLRMEWKRGNIIFDLRNSKPSDLIRNPAKQGIGLENLRRRLALLYPDKHTLEIKDEPKQFIVKLIIGINEV